MRTLKEIKKSITDEILNDKNLTQTIDLKQDIEWESQVSAVSLINLLIYVVAVAQYATEWLFEQFKQDVEKRIDAALPGTISWYWNKAMNFQYGDSLNINGVYDNIDSSKRIISHCSVIESNNGIIIKVNKENFQTLNDTEKAAFESYMNRIKFAGTAVMVHSYQPDELRLSLMISNNPLILTADGKSVPSNKDVVKQAVVDYLNGIIYGEKFNKTKLIDAIQNVPGIEDVVIKSCVFEAFKASSTTIDLKGQNYTSVCGHIELKELIFEEWNEDII